MPKEQFKKGDIIRRRLATNLLVGSCKVVDDVERYGVYAHDIPVNSLGSTYYKNESISKVKHLTLRIPNPEIKSIIDNRLFWVQHVLNKSWEEAIKQQYSVDKASIIVLTSNISHLIVTEPVFRRVMCSGKKYVRLEFVRILESIVK